MARAARDRWHRLLPYPLHMDYVDSPPLLEFHHRFCIIGSGHAQAVGTAVLYPSQSSVEWRMVPGGGLFENPGTKALLSQLPNRDLFLPVYDSITMSGLKSLTRLS